MSQAAGPAVTLDNCEREPIHIPGSIQPHGALLAFDRNGQLTHCSANAASMLGWTPRLGGPLQAADLAGQDAVIQAIRHAITQADAPEPEHESIELQIGDRHFDLVIRAHGGSTVCEFERRAIDDDAIASFARKAYRAMDRLKRHRNIEKLLEAAVTEVRAVTGFDRVMAYRFLHDDSGEVVAEARRADLDAYVGRRYPASDIPAQARRLYILNSLRLIADVGYVPVPLWAEASQTAPLDLSHSVLRSVSPVHVEYLQNMGVRASMSISIVIGGRLWGMLACHHMSALQVPYSIRMATDVIAHLVASSIQSITAKDREAAMAAAAVLRGDLTAHISHGEDTFQLLTREAAAVQDSLAADALLIALDGRLHVHAPVHVPWAQALVQWLSSRGQALVHLHRADDLPPMPPGPAGEAVERYCGVLALPFDASRAGWVVALRREQVKTIRWGGQPEKEITHGPLGPRLTPRGSFDEWRQTVRDTAAPWSDTHLEIGSLLADAVGGAHAARVMEVDRLRSQLWAVLGHDLRDPLQTLSMATQAMARVGSTTKLTGVIRNSTDRMHRLLRDLQDITRVQHGLGLSVEPAHFDLVPLLAQMAEESQVAHPDFRIDLELPETLVVRADRMRYIQVVTNLLSNARHHGAGHSRVHLALEGEHSTLTVSNASPPIPEDLLPSLFDPFKRSSMDNPRNRGGMGLGLYIAQQVAMAHGGLVSYEAADGEVRFSLRLPVAGPP